MRHYISHGNDGPDKTMLTMREALSKKLEEGYAGDVRIMTGYHGLDTLLCGGFHAGNLVVLAARPSIGKTSLALDIAYIAARHQKARVHIFSMEMDRGDIIDRMVSGTSGVGMSELRLGVLGLEDKRKVREAEQELSELPITIDTSSFLSLADMRSRTRMVAAKHGLDLVIIDYIDLMLTHSDNNVAEMSNITRKLKMLAKDLKVPVLALSHLDWVPEVRRDHRPQLSDTWESIEEVADVVMFLYRPDRYRDVKNGEVEVIVSKHRNGPTGTVTLYFDDDTASFHPLAVA